MTGARMDPAVRYLKTLERAAIDAREILNLAKTIAWLQAKEARAAAGRGDPIDIPPGQLTRMSDLFARAAKVTAWAADLAKVGPAGVDD